MKVPGGPNLMHKMTQMGLAFKTEGEDMLNRTVTSYDPSVSIVLKALQFDSNQKV